MNFGAHFTGVTLFGPPFVSTAADNGVSVDPVSKRIVLGDDGNAPNPGQLLSDRYIASMGFLLEIFGLIGTIDFLEALISILGDASSGNAAGIMLEDVNQPQHTANIIMDGVNARLQIQYATGVPSGAIINVQRQVNITGLGGGQPVTNALLEVTDGAMATQEPSANGPGEWRLGKVIAGAVALDPNNYIEVMIDGTIYKLLIAS